MFCDFNGALPGQKKGDVTNQIGMNFLLEKWLYDIVQPSPTVSLVEHKAEGINIQNQLF